MCFLFIVVSFFPMANFPMRVCIHYWLYGETEATPVQHLLETLIPFAVTLLGAVFLTDVGLVFSLVGSVETCSTYFLFPSAMVLASVKLRANPDTKPSRAVVAACWAVFVFGVFALVLGVISTLFYGGSG